MGYDNTMRTRIIVVCLGGIISLVCFYACSKRTIDAGESTVLQLREGICVGESADQVEVLLKRLKVEYGFYPGPHQFVGIVRRINQDALGYKSVRFVITIDEKGRVSNFLTEDIFTGL